MNRGGHMEGVVAATLERSLSQILRYLRFDAAVLYWHAPEFHMLWPMLQYGDLRDRVEPAMTGVQLIGDAFNAAVPLVGRDAYIASDGNTWLRVEEAKTVVSAPLGIGLEKAGLLVVFSRTSVEVTPVMLRAVSTFAAQMSIAMRRAPFYAIADLQQYQIEALTRIVGIAANNDILDDLAMYDIVAQQTRLLTGAHIVNFARSAGGCSVSDVRGDSTTHHTFVRRSGRRIRRAASANHTIVRYGLPSRSLTLGLLWRCAFQPSPQQRKLVNFIGHALAAIESLRERLQIAERERQAQYLSDVSKALSISLEPDVVLEQIQTLFVPEVADCVVADVRTGLEDAADSAGAAATQPEQKLLYDAVCRTRALENVSGGTSVRLAFHEPINGRLAEAIVAPVITRKGILGALIFGRSAARGEATAEQCALYEELAAHAALAIENAASFRKERDIAEVLQRALLATPLPKEPRLVFDAAYVPGSRLQVGGDWYDVFALDGDRYAISVGDVGGHGTVAAVTMNVVRLAFRAAALGGAGPVEVLERGDAMLGLEIGAPMVTAIYGVVDLRRNIFSYACAGHVPPYLVRDDGSIVTFPTAGHPLGIGLGDGREPMDMPLERGDTMVFFTDGLIEYDRDLFAGERRLQECLRTLIREEPRAALARNVHQMVFSGAFTQHDDTAILSVTMRPRSRTLEWRVPALLSAAPALRNNLRDFWDETPLGVTEPFEFLAATGEAIAGCLEHARQKKKDEIVVVASYDDEGITIDVADRAHNVEEDETGARVHLAFTSRPMGLPDGDVRGRKLRRTSQP